MEPTPPLPDQYAKRGKIFYGWYIVIAAALSNAAVGGIMVYGVTAMVDPIYAAFGWTYAQISLAITLRGVENGVLNPVVGFLADRFSGRKLMFAGTVLACGGLFMLSRVSNLAMFYGAFIIITLGTSLTSHLVPLTVIMRWFRANAAKASAWFSIGIGLGAFTVPIVTLAIDAVGWQTALAMLAGIILVIALPLVFVMRDRPEDYGMLPDGRQPDAVPQPAGEPVTEVVPERYLSVGQAVRTRAFWQIGFAAMFWIAGFASFVLWVMPYLEYIGVPRTVASLVAMAVPAVSLPARILMGWLADRYPTKNVIAVAIALIGSGLLLFGVVKADSTALLVICVIVLGVGLGGMTPLGAPLNREYFGTKHFGAIYGLGGVFFTLGSVVTPPLVGLFYDRTGGYGDTWLLLGGLALVGALVMFALPRPYLGKSAM
jgi:sugar phosphate permease